MASADAQQDEEDVLIEDAIADGEQVSTVVLEDSFSAKETILVVEDNEELQSFLSVQLSRYYKVLTANNGEEAMEVLKGEIVNLIVSDIMMPLKDGLELCNEIKSNLETCHIPIILLTAKTTLNNKIEGLNSGADAYMRSLLQCLIYWFRLKICWKTEVNSGRTLPIVHILLPIVWHRIKRMRTS